MNAAFKALGWLVLLTAFYPLGRAWLANRRTTLLHAVRWAMAAWVVWGWSFFPAQAGGRAVMDASVYLALCLTSCAGVAVLGARRPGVSTWNFVVAALLVVMLLPLAERLTFGNNQLALTGPRAAFLAGTLAVGILVNYLPTRLAPAALLLAAACAVEVWMLVSPERLGRWRDQAPILNAWLFGLAPWVACARLQQRPVPASQFDQRWLDFRDRFGLFWGQRLREQFNRAAAHAGWTVHLRWQGLRLQPGATLPDETAQEAILTTLRALMKRFGPEEDTPSAGSGNETRKT